MKLDRRVAIVTGACARPRPPHALELARHGARVVVNDIGEGAEHVATEILRAGGAAIAAVASVTDEAQVATMIEVAMARWGRIDILVNNAGFLKDRSFAKMTVAEFRDVVDVHLMGAVICTKAAWEIMRAQNHGRIVMTTSSAGLFGNFGQSNYGAAKMALVGLMQTLALEGAKHDIRVNCLAPTATTAMTESLLPEQAKALLGPERVSPALLKLVGEDAPSRAILCAGAGHFHSAYVTLTGGAFIGTPGDAFDGIAARWDAIVSRAEEVVPSAGTEQVQQELAAAMRHERLQKNYS